jgi:hypothetical protein
MLFRAVIFGVPVLATGRGWYSGSGAVHEVDGINGLDSLAVKPASFEARRTFIAACLSRQLHFDALSDPAQLERMLHRVGLGELLGVSA